MPRFVTSAARRVLPALALSLPLVAAHAGEPDRRNVVPFSATATDELTQDQLTVTLEAVKEGSQAADVQAELKRLLDAALTEARKQAQATTPEALSVRTGSFNLYPRYNNTGKANGWQGSAQLVLSGNDAGKVSQAAGKLNQLNVVNVSYGLSRSVREQHESQLTTEAIGRFKLLHPRRDVGIVHRARLRAPSGHDGHARQGRSHVGRRTAAGGAGQGRAVGDGVG